MTGYDFILMAGLNNQRAGFKAEIYVDYNDDEAWLKGESPTERYQFRRDGMILKDFPYMPSVARLITDEELKRTLTNTKVSCVYYLEDDLNVELDKAV